MLITLHPLRTEKVLYFLYLKVFCIKYSTKDFD